MIARNTKKSFVKDHVSFPGKLMKISLRVSNKNNNNKYNKNGNNGENEKKIEKKKLGRILEEEEESKWNWTEVYTMP